MSQISQNRQYPPSPEATTSAILGASSAGWSPVRTARRPESVAEGESGSPGKGTPQMPTHRANIAVLRSHGLVSNSIFKSSNPSPTHSQVSPHTSPLRQSPYQEHQRPMSQGGKMGVGLGISASPTKLASARSTSNSSMNSAHSTSDIENEEVPVSRNLFKSTSPRKSQGFKKLEKASYVSNSPFRKGGEDQDNRPMELPNNAWSVASSAAKSSLSSEESPRREKRPEKIGGVPRTPERTPQRTATAHNNGDPDFGTPTSQQGTPRGSRGGLSMDSPSSRGLLVSNRLHGPRIMESTSGTASPLDSPTRRERRKTVTFDEVLDVQEFDRESSFDGHSLQSGSSQASSLNGVESSHVLGSPEEEEMWLQGSANKVVERLMVVNGTPETASSVFSTPDLEQNDHKQYLERHNEQPQSSEMVDSSSNDSREMSSVDEPQSPPPENVSFDHEHADKTFNTAPDVSFFNESIYVDQESDLSGGNLSAYGALHRVDSLVDELLEGDLLGRGGKGDESCGAIIREESPPRRRKAGGNKLGDEGKGSKPLPIVPAPSSMLQPSSHVQLSLPEWSPLMGLNDSETPQAGIAKKEMDKVESGLQQVQAPAAIPVAKARAAIRPHISRDAVLQRVAREKKMQEEQEAAGRVVLETRDEGAASPIKSQGPLTMRRSEGAALKSRSPSGTIIVNRAEVSSSNATCAFIAPAPVPSKHAVTVQLESPLERLSAEVAAEQEQATKENLLQQGRKPLAHSASTKRQERWFEDEKPNHLQVENQSITSGRISPSLTPSQQAEQIIARRRSKNGKSTVRAMGRRSLSEGAEGLQEEKDNQVMQRLSPAFAEDNNDAELREEELLRSKHMLDASLKNAIDGGFETGLEREISRIYRQGDQKYKINDRGVFTSNAEDKVNHSAQAGDVDSGKAWKKLRRPSDMNEYAKEMKEYRENENPKKAAGKIYVMVDSFTPTALPIPTSKPTRFHCILDNGLHIVRTATNPLLPGPATSKIGQEFELIQHKNLVFSLTMVAHRDSHLQEPQPESPTNTRKMTPSFSRGMGKLFSSPKKKSSFVSSSTNASMASSAGFTVEPMLAFLNKESSFGKCEVVFEKIAQDCLGKAYIMDLPIRGEDDVDDDAASSLSPSLRKNSSPDFKKNLGIIRGTLKLKLFYLPPMPSVARNLMPRNLGECIQGMEAALWHSQNGEAWMEGVLTQLGGDCVSWRRRPVKAKGAHLIGYNEITKKPTVKIDLRKAVSIEQSHDPVNNTAGSYAMDDEELDETYHVERSFRITFKDGEKIYFFADTDEERNKWLTVLKKVITNKEIPANCVWATVALEMIKAAKEKKSTSASTSTAATTPLSSKRVPVKHNEPPLVKVQSSTPTLFQASHSTQQQQSPTKAALQQPLQQSPSKSPSSLAPPSQRHSRVLVQPALSAVLESPPIKTTMSPEQTPTKRRPVSALPLPRPVSNGKMSVERPYSVYVDGRS